MPNGSSGRFTQPGNLPAWLCKPYSSHEMPERAQDSVAYAFQMTLDLFETGVDLMRQNLRRSRPEANDAEIERLLGEWLLDRPGAESGDCAGKAVDPAIRLT